MQLQFIMNGKGLNAVGLGDFMDFSPPDDRRYLSMRGSEFEAFVQQEVVESSDGYDLCMPVVQDRAICLGDLIDW